MDEDKDGVYDADRAADRRRDGEPGQQPRPGRRHHDLRARRDSSPSPASPNGNYTIVVTDNGGELAGRERTTPDAIAGQRAITVAGANLTGAHFGYAQPGLIGDRVWSDTDGDGVQDPGEAGIGGVTVELLGPGPDGLLFTGDDVVLATTTTARRRQLRVRQPGARAAIACASRRQAVLTGYTQTGDPNVPNAALRRPACDLQGSSTLTLGATDRNLDFGFRNNARPDISGTVFEDRNRNGVLDAAPAGRDRHRERRGRPGGRRPRRHLRHRRTTWWSPPPRPPPTAPTPSSTCRTATTASRCATARGVLDGYELTSGRDQIPVTVAGVEHHRHRLRLRAQHGDRHDRRHALHRRRSAGPQRPRRAARADRAAAVRRDRAPLHRRRRQRRDRAPATARRSPRR